MRVAMVASKYPLGGAEQVPRLLVEGMEARHEMYFITAGEEDREFREGGHTRVVLAATKPRFWHHYVNPALVGKLRRLLARIRPDVVHFHSIHNRTFSASVMKLTREYPSVWSMHDVWSQCIWSKSRPPLCEGMGRQCAWCPRGPGLSIVNRIIKEHYWKLADVRLIHCSEWMKRFFAASALGKKPSVVIPNGVDLARFRGLDRMKLRGKLGIPADARVVLFVGNMLLPQKGHVELLRMAESITARSADARFVFVGAHAERPRSNPRILFTGTVDPAEIPACYAAADLFAFPSHVEYAPLVILEAMAAGVAPVAYGVGGIPEQVVDGVTGVLVAPGDEETFESRLAGLLDDPERRRAMGEASRRRAEECFRLETQVARTEKVYEEAISARRGGPVSPRVDGSRMRIASVVPRYPFGGAEQVAANLVEGMESRHDVTFITAGERDAEYAEGGHRRIVLALGRRPKFWHHFSNRRLVKKLRESIARVDPDVIHFHNLGRRTFSVSALLLSRERPTVWSLHDLWSLGAWSVPHRGGCPCVDGAGRFLKERVYRKADLHVIVPCEWLKSRLEGSALASKPVHVIPNGVAVERFAAGNRERARGRLGIPPEARVVLFAGGMLDNGKGWEDLLRLARPMAGENKSLWFLFVGPREGAPASEERILFTGEAPAGEMPDSYASADVFAYPTHADVFPGVVLEAMASGLPVVTHDVGGISEAVADGETGFVVAEGDSPAFEKRLRTLVGDPARAHTMGAAGRARAKEKFTLALQVERTERVYREAIAERAGKGG